jgi:CDP-diacylglycerol--serine O-phosphatidyltransferase
MRKLTKHIPNILTCANLAFGFYSIILSFSGQYPYAMVAIFMAALFDFTDGFAARLLKAFSPIGKDLDSLADMVSFGVAPGAMLFCFFKDLATANGLSDNLIIKLFLLSAFLIPVFSALRLAKFNIDDRQKSSFIGLPVPAHAIFWASLLTALCPSIHTGEICLIMRIDVFCFKIAPIVLIAVLSILAVVTSLLLVSEFPMFSLKIKSFSWKENKPVIILFFTAIVLIALFGIIGISATILFYILINIAKKQE